MNRLQRARLRDQLETALLLALENHQDYIASEALDALPEKEKRQIVGWCQTMMYEASDNPVRARYAPKALRQLLPPDHYLHRWRKPKQRTTGHGQLTNHRGCGAAAGPDAEEVLQMMGDPADTSNWFLVCSDAKGQITIRVDVRARKLTKAEAVNLAAWLVAHADPEQKTFPALLAAVLG